MASSMSWEEARDLLRKLREDQARNSEEVLELWEHCADFSKKVGDELWLICEQVCIAACDCGRPKVAQSCIDALKNQFPDSLRVRKLEGLLFEVQGKYEEAGSIYNSILKEDETNSLVRKRLVAIQKGQNKIPEAIKELAKYLEQYMSDYDAWLELCDLYLYEGDYAKACFSMEELILSNPHNHLYHQKYAEIKYTQGGPENMELARAYFAQALKGNPNNMRALYGLFMAASNIASSSRSNAKVKKDNMKYAAWASTQISQKYKAGVENIGIPLNKGRVASLIRRIHSVNRFPPELQTLVK